MPHIRRVADHDIEHTLAVPRVTVHAKHPLDVKKSSVGILVKRVVSRHAPRIVTVHQTIFLQQRTQPVMQLLDALTPRQFGAPGACTEVTGAGIAQRFFHLGDARVVQQRGLPVLPRDWQQRIGRNDLGFEIGQAGKAKVFQPITLFLLND